MKHTTSGTYVIIAIAAVIVGCVAFSRTAAVEAVYPLERLSSFVRRSVWPRIKGVFNGPGYAAECGRLKREVKALSLLTGEVERLERENAALRRSLKYVARSPERWLAAPVLASHGGAVSGSRIVRVGRGSFDGVVDGAVVTSPDGLVGQVVGVTAHTSEIMLLLDPKLKVSCAIELGGSRSASGILEGGDGDKLVISHIRGLATDMPRARVLTSGRGGVFPKGIEVGTLIRASAGENGEWYGEVRPGADFDELEDLFISRER